MIQPIDPSASHRWNPNRQSRQGDRPASRRQPTPERFENVLQEELTLWHVLLEPEPAAIPEKSGFAAVFEAAERTAEYRIAFYQEHEPVTEAVPEKRGNWWDTLA